MSPLIVNDVNYTTGMSAMDAEHAAIVKAIDEITNAPETAPAEYLQQLFAKIVCKFNAHLEHEEAIMRQHKYPNIEVHKRIHKQLQDFLATQTEFIAGSTPEKIRTAALDTLRILLKHVIESDLSLATFISRADPLFSE